METHLSSSIQKNVMRRVRIMHIGRMVLSGDVLAVVTLILSLYIIGREVWVARVFHNMPPLTNLPAFSQFWVTAFSNTRSIVQLLVAVIIVAGIYLMRELIRFVSTNSTTLIPV